ncbi:MAG: FAD-dependent oxidoreductase [Casimicrobiaceae bacterium]
MSKPYDVAVIGGGIMGASAALFLARGGMSVVLIDRGELCREASGVNAGTLTLHMTRAALIPYAQAGWRMWTSTAEWLGASVDAVATPGLSLAFTDAEVEMLERRAAVRREHGADIRIIDPRRATEIEPGLNPQVLRAAYCETDGYASAYLTGRAFRQALTSAAVDVVEQQPVIAIDQIDRGFMIRAQAGTAWTASRIVLAGGVWLGTMLAWLGVDIAVKCLINQLIVTERMPAVMRTVLSVASGLLSLKQFRNGTVLIGGGWQGLGDPERGGVETVPDNLVGNLRLAQWTVPALAATRINRIWLGLEAETADALPLLGPVPGVREAYVIGSVHSGYTSGPYMGKLLAQRMLGANPAHPLFDPARLVGVALSH